MEKNGTEGLRRRSTYISGERTPRRAYCLELVHRPSSRALRARPLCTRRRRVVSQSIPPAPPHHLPTAALLGRGHRVAEPVADRLGRGRRIEIRERGERVGREKTLGD